MTKVKVKRADYIESISVSDHACYDSEGYDIVCASISSMTILAFNVCESFDKGIDIKQDESYLEINIKEYNLNIETVLNNYLLLVEELVSQYPDNITLL